MSEMDLNTCGLWYTSFSEFKLEGSLLFRPLGFTVDRSFKLDIIEVQLPADTTIYGLARFLSACGYSAAKTLSEFHLKMLTEATSIPSSILKGKRS